jgi:hypothetical protein
MKFLLGLPSYKTLDRAQRPKEWVTSQNYLRPGTMEVRNNFRPRPNPGLSNCKKVHEDNGLTSATHLILNPLDVVLNASNAGYQAISWRIFLDWIKEN